MPAWLRYTILRLLLIVVPLVILMLLFRKDYWPLWTIVSVVIGVTLSYIFLRGPREAMAAELAAKRAAQPVVKGDDAAEDAEIDASAREEN
jgi:type VI protein secretion system component VasK